MSDEGEQLSNERRTPDIEGINRLPYEYAVEIEFPVIDAALWVYVGAYYDLPNRLPELQFVREQVTFGSVQYILHFRPPDPQEKPMQLAVIEVRNIMGDRTYLAVRPIIDAPLANHGTVFLNGVYRMILWHFLRWVLDDQQRIHDLSKERTRQEPRPDATAREHALFHHLKLEPQGIKIEEYAKQIAIAQQSLYNERKKLGITTPRGGRKRSKSK